MIVILINAKISQFLTKGALKTAHSVLMIMKNVSQVKTRFKKMIGPIITSTTNRNRTLPRLCNYKHDEVFPKT